MDRLFNLLDYAIAFRKPRRLTDVDFWHLHIPFAFVITAMLKPERFVELGTHKGDSYCAFCQAVDELGLNTACYAVDSWQGDEHTGFYGEEVLEELRAYHDPLYGSFSSLAKCLFDDALDYFSDGSIDLLHIDGHHTYDSVRHDFESWLPKMSKRGVVLFHDTNVREREFGVWRLWQEISDQYPDFEFKFGNGLGVLAVGEDIEESIQAFLERGEEEDAAMGSLFYNLGINILLTSGNNSVLGELNLLRKVTSELEHLVSSKDTQLKQADQWLKEIQLQVQEKENELKQIGELRGELQSQIESKDHLLNEIFTSKGWLWLTRLRNIKRKLSFQKGVELLKKEQNTDEKTYQAKIIHPIQKNRPKIIHAIGNIMIGGSTRLVVDLIEYLGHKYDQEVITNFVPSPAAYTGFPYHLFSEPATPEDIAAFLQERAADILHIHYWGEPWYRKVFGAARNCTCRVVENINTPLEPFVQDGIEKYIFVSNYVMNLSDAADRSAVIYPGSDLKMFQRGGAPIPDDAIGMVYRLEEDKLMGDSIQVFIKVVKKRPQTKAYIVGGGILFDSYRNQTINEGVAENFVFTGYVAYEKLPEYYRKLSLFVAPVWSESFGQVSPFAMSMKIPVVGYNIGALPEILGSADCLRKDPTKLAELIIGLLDDRQKRIEIGTANYARACDFFSIENMIRKYDLLYSRLLK